MFYEANKMPEYKYTDKIDYTKPIPPHLLYEEESGSPKKRVNHLKNLAQTCSKYSQEFDNILNSIPVSYIASLFATSPRQNDQEQTIYEEFQSCDKIKLLNHEQERETEIRPSLKRKKKNKKSKKSLKKLAKHVELSQDEEAIDKNQEKIESFQIKTIPNITHKPNITDLANLPSIVSRNVNEKKSQRFKPYEKQKLPIIESTVLQQKEPNKSNNQNRTCPWLVNGTMCGKTFANDDLFNDHIKNHTTESIFTDLNFYYQAKNVLNSNSLKEVY